MLDDRGRGSGKAAITGFGDIVMPTACPRPRQNAAKPDSAAKRGQPAEISGRKNAVEVEKQPRGSWRL